MTLSSYTARKPAFKKKKKKEEKLGLFHHQNKTEHIKNTKIDPSSDTTVFIVHFNREVYSKRATAVNTSLIDDRVLSTYLQRNNK